jgi:hypothetical protein
MKVDFTRLARLAALVCFSMLLSSCASNAVKTDTVGQRAQERWDKVLSGDLAGAYEYLSPGYRSSVSSLAYQRSMLTRAVQWTTAEYRKSECDDSTCDVTVQVGFSVRGALPGVKSYDGEKDVHESWVRIDGIWYYVP